MKKLMMLLLTMLLLTGCAEEIPYIETTLSEEAVADKFYYNELETDEEKLIYKEIYEGFLNRLDEFYTHGNTETDMDKLFNAVLYDFPEIFWCDSETVVKYDIYEEHVIMYPEYEYSAEEVSEMKQNVEAMTQECVQGIEEQSSDYEKVKYVYEYLINSVDYVDDVANDQNIYSALVAKETVCAGYAKSVQYLLEQAGVPCITVIGTAQNEGEEAESHAWNIVNCDGENYYVDATWGDPEEQSEGALMIYDYLCCSEAQLEATHVIEEDFEYPDCTSEDLNYYRMNGTFYENADEDAILSAMKDSIADKEGYTTFKFSNKEDYEEALSDMENKLLDKALTYLANYYGLRQSNCTYDYHETLYKINVYWSYE